MFHSNNKIYGKQEIPGGAVEPHRAQPNQCNVPRQRNAHRGSTCRAYRVNLTVGGHSAWDKAGYTLSRELAKKLRIPLNAPDKIGNAIARLRADDKAFLLRRVMMEQYGGNYPRSAHGNIIRKIAEGYGDIDINSFEAEQREIRDKREAGQRERLKTLMAKQPAKTGSRKKSSGKKTKRQKMAA